MKVLLQLISIVTLCSSSALFAAQLEVPMAFEYIALDGKKVSKSSFLHKSDLELSEGHHEIAIRYRDMVEDDLIDTESEVKSAVFIISLNVRGGFNYSLKPAGGGAVRNPQQFAKSPNVIIARGDNGQVDYKVTLTDITDIYDKSNASRLYGRDGIRADATAASTDSAAATTQATSLITQPVVSDSSRVITDGGVSAGSSGKDPGKSEQMLRHWWQQADEKTRKEFLGWAIKQL